MRKNSNDFIKKSYWKTNNLKTKLSFVFMILIICQIQANSVFSLNETMLNYQQQQVNGKVTDKEGMPLPGVTVLVKGTTNGVSSNFDGNFSITASKGDVIVFSYVGKINVEITIENTNTLNIVLEDDISTLDEIVVVAYGSQTKKSIVGSVSSINSSTIENQIATSPLSALQGSVPGVNLNTFSGQPGATPTIRIRGFGSINGSLSPLIIVDGAQFNGNINTISQDQIESISVLKDASSAALYGSRASNGVVLITTKKGAKNSAPKIRLRSQLTLVSTAVDFPDFLGPEDQMKLSWEALKNTNQYRDFQSPSDAAQNASNQLIDYLGYNPYGVNNPIDANGNLVAGANLLWETDWEALLINKNSPRINHGLTVSGGDDKTTYFASIDYLDETGLAKTSDFERIATRLNLESQLTDRLKFGLSTSYSTSDSSIPNQNDDVESLTRYINTVSSLYPVYVRDENGALIKDENGNNLQYDAGDGGFTGGQSVNSIRPVAGASNIVGSLALNRLEEHRTNYFGNAFLELKLLEGLTIKTQLSYENYLKESFAYVNSEIGFGAGFGGSVSNSKDNTTTINAVQSLNYVKAFGNHNINVDLLTEANESELKSLNANGTNLLPGSQVITGAVETGGEQNSSKSRLNGYLGRVAYNYNGTYFAEVSARRDGSSRFSSETRWGNFYAGGASWIVSNENFLKNSNTVNYLKVKASYGELGNNRGFGNFPYQSVFELGSNNQGNLGILLGGVSNELLTWEKTLTLNTGIDFELFNGVLSGSVEYYEKESVDLIFDQPISPSLGITEITTNIGSIKNSGLEFVLSSVNVNTDNFKWTSSLNFSLNKNEITELTVPEQILGSRRLKVGSSLYEFYIREWAGVNPADGRGMWYKDVLDANGDVIDKITTTDYDEATRYDSGSSIPDITGGFTTAFKYKQFDLNILANFSFGGKILDSDYAAINNSFSSPGNTAHTDVLARWQNPGDITNVPRLQAHQNDHSSGSTRFLFDNDYVRLRSVTFGYNFPESVLNKIGLTKLRLYFLADNLFTIQSHKGIDPAQSFNGTTRNRTRLPKSIGTGLVLEF